MSNNPVQWSALGTAAVLLTSSSSSTGMMSLSTGFSIGGEAYNNASGYQYGDLQVRVRGSAAFAAGDYLSGWFLRDLSGSQYEDPNAASTAATPVARPADFAVPVRAVATQQVISVPLLTLPPCAFKVYIQNLTTKALTSSTGENEIRLFPYNDNLVATT